MKKGREDGWQPSTDEKVLNNEIVGTGDKVCDSDPGCGKSDTSSGWREEYHHQRVAHPEA